MAFSSVKFLSFLSVTMRTQNAEKGRFAHMWDEKQHQRNKVLDTGHQGMVMTAGKGRGRAGAQRGQVHGDGRR